MAKSQAVSRYGYGLIKSIALHNYRIKASKQVTMYLLAPNRKWSAVIWKTQ